MKNHCPENQQKFSHSLSGSKIRLKIRAKFNNTIAMGNLRANKQWWELIFKRMLEH